MNLINLSQLHKNLKKNLLNFGFIYKTETYFMYSSSIC